jgi:hypothetical protein
MHLSCHFDLPLLVRSLQPCSHSLLQPCSRSLLQPCSRSPVGLQHLQQPLLRVHLEVHGDIVSIRGVRCIHGIHGIRGVRCIHGIRGIRGIRYILRIRGIRGIRYIRGILHAVVIGPIMREGSEHHAHVLTVRHVVRTPIDWYDHPVGIRDGR